MERQDVSTRHLAGKKKVWEGYTYACLGYVHIKIDKPVKAKDITIRMMGDAKSKTQLSDTKELAGGKASTLDFIRIKKGKPVLRIVEIDFLKNKRINNGRVYKSLTTKAGWQEPSRQI